MNCLMSLSETARHGGAGLASLASPKLSVDDIFELIDFVDGQFFWKKRSLKWCDTQASCDRWNTKYAGEPIYLRYNRGYKFIRVLGQTYFIHRLVWLFTYQQWPIDQLDHIDGDRGNNSITNLRDVNITINNQNRSLSRNNTSGCMGVWWRPERGKWEATIYFQKKKIFLGNFVKKADAINARLVALNKYGFGPNHGRVSI